MPYIDVKKRQKINKSLEEIEKLISVDKEFDVSPSEGDMNYIITILLLTYLSVKGESYATYNSIIGILECVKQEIYRRKISGYENKKIDINGDVF